MLRNVFTKTIRDRRRTILWWMLGSAALISWVSGVYPIMRDSDAMQQFIEDFPPELMAMFGIDPDTYLTGAGFLQAQFFTLFAPIMMIALAISIAVASTGREEKDGTMDMLLSAPISRTSLVLQKSGALVLLSGSVVATIALTLIVMNEVIGLGLKLEGVLAANLALWLLGLVFGGITLMAAAFSGRPSAAIGLGVLLAVVAWFVNGFAGIFDWLETPNKVNPFGWYLQGTPLLNGLNSGQAWLGLATAVLIGMAVVLFNRRDISTEQSVVPESAGERRKAKVVEPRSTLLLTGVFLKSVWDRRRSVWAWAAGLATMMLLTFAAWPAFSKDTEAITNLIDSMPKEIFALFGMTDTESLATAAGFISSRTYGSVGPIVMMIFAIGGVSSLIAKEESRGVMDLVLSNPLPRRRVLLAKAAATATLALFIGLLLALFGLMGNAVYGTELEPFNIVTANLGLALLALCFGGIALAVWSLLGTGPAIGITAAIATAAWFLNGLGAIVNTLAPLRLLSPFYWYLGDKAPLTKGFDPQYLLLLAVALAGAAVAAWRFETRDLSV